MHGENATGIRHTLRETLNKWWHQGPPKGSGSKVSDRAALYTIIGVWNQIRAGKEDKVQIRAPKLDNLRSPRTIVPTGFPPNLFFVAPRQMALAEMEQSMEAEHEDNGA